MLAARAASAGDGVAGWVRREGDTGELAGRRLGEEAGGAGQTCNQDASNQDSGGVVWVVSNFRGRGGGRFPLTLPKNARLR